MHYAVFSLVRFSSFFGVVFLFMRRSCFFRHEQTYSVCSTCVEPYGLARAHLDDYRHAFLILWRDLPKKKSHHREGNPMNRNYYELTWLNFRLSKRCLDQAELPYTLA